MKSDNDLQNSDNCVVLKTVSPQILDKLRESGLTVCTCCEFPVSIQTKYAYIGYSR